MPLYEYRCASCGRVFEVSHEVGGRPGPCPVCGGEGRRIFTSVGLIFKGSGFHTTDYRQAATKSGANGAGAADAAAPDGGATKDAKPGEGGSKASPSTGTSAGSEAPPKDS